MDVLLQYFYIPLTITILLQHDEIILLECGGIRVNIVIRLSLCYLFSCYNGVYYSKKLKLLPCKPYLWYFIQLVLSFMIERQRK